MTERKAAISTDGRSDRLCYNRLQPWYLLGQILGSVARWVFLHSAGDAHVIQLRSLYDRCYLCQAIICLHVVLREFSALLSRVVPCHISPLPWLDLLHYPALPLACSIVQK